MENNSFPEYEWVQESIGSTMLETHRLEEIGRELEERLTKLKEEKEPWEERTEELSLDGDLYLYSGFEMEDKVYYIFARNPYGISRMFRHIFENPDIGDSKDVTLICDGECRYLMN